MAERSAVRRQFRDGGSRVLSISRICRGIHQLRQGESDANIHGNPPWRARARASSIIRDTRGVVRAISDLASPLTCVRRIISRLRCRSKRERRCGIFLAAEKFSHPPTWSWFARCLSFSQPIRRAQITAYRDNFNETFCIRARSRSLIMIKREAVYIRLLKRDRLIYPDPSRKNSQS